MSACPQCGTVAKPTDKFCNVCGTPLAAAPGAGAPPPGFVPQPGFSPTPPPPPPAFGAPPPQGPAFGAQPPAGGPPPSRCQMGHDIAPGASYCAQGHPIALDQMQFANDAYGAQGGGGFGGAPRPPQGFAGPPPAASPYGAPPPVGYGAPAPAPGYPQAAQYGGPGPAFGAPPPQPGYGGPQPQGYAPPPAPGYPPQGQPGYGGPAPGYPAPGAPMAPGAAFGPGDPSLNVAGGRVLRGFLVAYGANAAGDFWPLHGGRLTVGRLAAADGIDISLQDPTISSRHAAMNIDGATGGIAVEDTGSTNGTFVNDEHIGFNGRRELRDGDRIRFGGFTTIVKVIGRV